MPISAVLLERGSAAARLMGLRVRMPPGTWASVSCDGCWQVEVSVLGRSLVQRSPTECGVSECDLETSKTKRLMPTMAAEPWKKYSILAKFWKRSNNIKRFEKHGPRNYFSIYAKYVVWQYSSRTHHRVLAVAALDKSLSMVWWRSHISICCCCWSMAESFWVASITVCVCFVVPPRECRS